MTDTQIKYAIAQWGLLDSALPLPGLGGYLWAATCRTCRKVITIPGDLSVREQFLNLALQQGWKLLNGYWHCKECRREHAPPQAESSGT